MTAGIAAALLVTRVLSPFLFETTPTDPATFAGVSSFAAVIVLASYLPARRAASVDPRTALRDG